MTSVLGSISFKGTCRWPPKASCRSSGRRWSRTFQGAWSTRWKVSVVFDLIADRPAGRVEPNSVFRHRPNGLGDERGVIRPFADRVAVKPLLPHFLPDLHAAVHQFGELSPVRPDDSPAVIILIENHDLDVILKDLRLPHLVMIHVRHPERIAEFPWIVLLPGVNCVKAFERLVRLVNFQSVRRIGH